jgi:hypothetical protein
VMFITLSTAFLHLWGVGSAILQYTGANRLILARPTPSPGLELALFWCSSLFHSLARSSVVGLKPPLLPCSVVVFPQTSDVLMWDDGLIVGGHMNVCGEGGLLERCVRTKGCFVVEVEVTNCQYDALASNEYLGFSEL